jgi:hypothetical protein
MLYWLSKDSHHGCAYGYMAFYEHWIQKKIEMLTNLVGFQSQGWPNNQWRQAQWQRQWRACLVRQPPPPNQWMVEYDHRDGWGYEDEAWAQMTHRYALFGPQVSPFYVSFLIFFIQLTSIFIIYRFYLTMTLQWQPMHCTSTYWLRTTSCLGIGDHQRATS